MAATTQLRSKTPILLTLCLAALIINIDVTIVNVALPSLVRELGATTTNLQWIVDAYTLVFAALILAAGSLSDRVGRKGILLLGLGVFGLGSLGGALSTSSGQLIAARAVMGIGAAAIFPSTLSLIANVFTERTERAKAIGLWGATTGVGVAAGPIVGGWLLEHYWWGSVFLFMVPLAALVAFGVASSVPTSKDPAASPIDWPGLVLSCAAMGTLVFAIIQAPDWGWASTSTLAAFALGLALLAVFINVEARSDRPMLDVSLFRNPRFSAASGSITISFFSLAGFTFLVTQYFQFVHGYSPLGTGIRLLRHRRRRLVALQPPPRHDHPRRVARPGRDRSERIDRRRAHRRAQPAASRAHNYRAQPHHVRRRRILAQPRRQPPPRGSDRRRRRHHGGGPPTFPTARRDGRQRSGSHGLGRRARDLQ